MKAFLSALVAACVVVACGCGEDPKTATRKEFEHLYKEYSTRFHETIASKKGTMTGAEVATEADRIWNEVFGPHKDLVRRRAEDILAELDTAAPIDEKDYNQVIQAAPPANEDERTALRHFLWNPIGAAQNYLNTLFTTVLQPEDRTRQAILSAHAALLWEAVARNPDHPKLLLRQGPWVFLADLSWNDDYYRVDRLRWLQHVGADLVRVEEGAGAPAPVVPAPPSPPPPATPPEGPRG